ncbi:MAG: hypothetical protein HYY93_11570 [Planctomycetes bacterium]|nr:hypothetical protein [Planctomycetota bacterium]
MDTFGFATVRGIGGPPPVPPATDARLYVDSGTGQLMLSEGGLAFQRVASGTNLLHLGVASPDLESTPSDTIFVDGGGGGNLLRLQSGAADKFVVGPGGEVDTFGFATVRGIGGPPPVPPATDARLYVDSGTGTLFLSEGGSAYRSLALIGAPNTFTGTQTFTNLIILNGAMTLGAGTGAESLVIDGDGTASDTVSISDDVGADNITIGSDNFGGADNIRLRPGTGVVALGNSTAASTINIGTGTGLDTISIGTGGGTDAITIGSFVGGAQSTVINSDNIELGNTADIRTINIGGGGANAADTISIGTGGGGDLITIGTDGDPSAATINIRPGTAGTITLGNGAANDTIEIGGVGGNHTINIGGGTGTDNVTIGGDASAETIAIGSASDTINVGAKLNWTDANATSAGGGADSATGNGVVGRITIGGAGGASTLAVTNSSVAAGSHVFVTLNTAGAAYVQKVSIGAGSFTVTFVSGTLSVGDTVDFLVVN